jgi:hypothetical protein
MFKNLSDENRFIALMAIILVGGLLILIILNRFGKLNSDVIQNNKLPKEKTVIVSDAEKNAILAAVPKKVVESMREAGIQGEASTAHLQLSRAPQSSQEAEELKHLIESDAKLKKRTGVQKVRDTPSAPLRYMDQSTPRDKSVDALYLYLVDVGANILPRFCVQTVGKGPMKLDGFKITADGKEFMARHYRKWVTS